MGRSRAASEAATGGLVNYVRHAEQLSPRVKLAIRFWASGSCKTQAEAARLAGIHPVYLAAIVRHSPLAKDMIARIDEGIENGTINMSQLLLDLGKRAARNMAFLMENGEKEDIRFRAAQDLLDRSPETIKTQRHEINAFQIAPDDAAGIIAAIADSAAARKKLRAAAEGDFVLVEEPPQRGDSNG